MWDHVGVSNLQLLKSMGALIKLCEKQVSIRMLCSTDPRRGAFYQDKVYSRVLLNQ